jgi:NADH pyrophosphatase NudC (nudix superfamily)
MHPFRTHTCGELRPAHVGETVRLSGWVHRKRDHGHLLFLDLRDHYGLTQCVIESGDTDFAVADTVRLESVVTVTGECVARAAATHLSPAETGILAQSRAQVDWHRRHQFCSVCGQRTIQGRGGHVRQCPACKTEHFPRTDPVAIMVVSDGERCLLGQSRGRLSRTGTYSALAR